MNEEAERAAATHEAVVATGRTAAGQFAKGRSGNPKGRPPTAPDIRAAAARYSVAAVDLLGSILLDETASKQQRQQAAIVLLRISGRWLDDPADNSEQQHQRPDDAALQDRAARLNQLYHQGRITPAPEHFQAESSGIFAPRKDGIARPAED